MTVKTLDQILVALRKFPLRRGQYWGYGPLGFKSYVQAMVALKQRPEIILEFG